MPTMPTIPPSPIMSHHVPHCNTCSKDKASWSCCQQPHSGLEQENAEAHLARSWDILRDGHVSSSVIHHLRWRDLELQIWPMVDSAAGFCMVLPGLRSSLESLQAMELRWITAGVLEGSKEKHQICMEIEVLFIITCLISLDFTWLVFFKIYIYNYIYIIIYI